MNKPSTYKEAMTQIFYATSKAPKSCTIQEILVLNGIDKRELK